MQEVYQQLYSLVAFVITGIVIGILFDIFRILRKSFKTGNWITYIQDILFWILTGVIVLFSIFQFNYGEIRSYVFLGIFLGILLYMIIFSKFFIRYSVIAILFLKKLIFYPICFIGKNIIVPIKSLIQKIKEIGKNIYKMTKNNKKIRKKQTNLKEKRGIL